MRRASRRVLMNFLCFDLFAGRADEDELFQTLQVLGSSEGAAWCRRKRGILGPASSRANGDARTAAAQHPSHALALPAVVYGILLPARKSGRWQSGSDREGHNADTTRLCWFCVLRNLRGYGVR